MKPLVFSLAFCCLAGIVFAQAMDIGTGGGGIKRVDRDSLLIGRWSAIISHDETGVTRNESFEIEYRPDGKAAFNRAALFTKFNQQRIRHGFNAVSLSEFNRYFPRITWKTENNRIVLTFKSGLGTNDISYFYQITGDTLTTVNESLILTQRKLVAVRNHPAR